MQMVFLFMCIANFWGVVLTSFYVKCFFVFLVFKLKIIVEHDL